MRAARRHTNTIRRRKQNPRILGRAFAMQLVRLPSIRRIAQQIFYRNLIGRTGADIDNRKHIRSSQRCDGSLSSEIFVLAMRSAQ